MNKENEEQREQASDIELVQKSVKGDEEAYHQLVRKYQQKVYAIAYGIIHNREDALDIAQEVFIKIYKKLRSFRGSSAFYTWLYRITVNLSIDYQRKKKAIVSVDYSDEILDDSIREDRKNKSIEYSPIEVLKKKELNRIILDAIDKLPEEQKAVLMLRELEGLSYEEIAKVCKCSLGTVMSRLHYGRRKLKEKLLPYLS